MLACRDGPGLYIDTMTHAMGDKELLASWRDGDQRAGAALFEKHYMSVSRFFRNKVNGPAQDDLVQQTFLTCAEKVEGFRGASSFRTFLFGIAHNILREYLRTIGRKRAREADKDVDFDQLSVTALGQSPESAAAVLQEQRLLLEGLRRIPLHYQVALELHYWEQLTAKEIGEVTGVPLGTAKTRLRDGKKLLARTLEEIATSAALLQSTVEDLEGWAARVRGQVAVAGR